MKKNGFTLVELIAVITLLSMIVLVSVPVIINTINRAKEKEYNEFKQVVENAAELYLVCNMDLYPELSKIGDSIEVDASVLVNEGYLKHDLTDPIDDNNVSKYKVVITIGQNEVIEYQTVERKTFRELVTKTKDVPNINACALSGKCEPGTKFAIEVNDEQVYNFYVISDDGEEVTLIMDRNLGDRVFWITVEDYAVANVDGTFCAELACSDEGPVTALNELEKRTNNWTNISMKDYVYSDDGGVNRYIDFTKKMRTRMLTYTEATTLGCTSSKGSCPSWLYGTNSYWLSATSASWTTNARDISSDGSISGNSVYNTPLWDGIRPVITVSRSL